MSVASRFLRLFPWMLLALLPAACSLDLRLPPGPPRYAPVGLWFAAGRSGQPDFALSIEPTGQTGPGQAWRFTELALLQRDLLVSGKVAFFSIRTGSVRTSAEEVLLYQEVFQNYRQSHKGKEPSDVWPAEGYAPVDLEREVRRGGGLRLLDFQEAGAKLSDGELTYVRVGSPEVPAAAVVVLVDRVRGRALAVAPGRSDWDSLSIQAPGGPGPRVLGREVMRYTLALEGNLERGRALYAGRVAAAKTAPLTKEQVLDKLRRGEKVSNEDLIRVLGPGGKKSP